MADAEDDFAGLSERQQRAVDRAFDRALRSTGARPAKRRRLAKESRPSTPASAPGGGFIDEGGFLPDDGGGFIPDDGGGFMPDDGGGFLPDDGGFIPDDGGFMPDDPMRPSSVPSASMTPKPEAGSADDRIPLSVVPSVLASLGLPSDEDVLAVFRASASGWGEGEGNGIERKDFRAVCAALMGPDDADEDADAAPDTGDVSSDSGDSDVFRPSDDDDDFDDADGDDGEYGARTPASASRTRAKRRGLEAAAAPKLSSQQKQLAADIWAMLKPDKGRGAHILGRDEVKRWARELGEMWTDDEITDMVALFSSQHEGRGLSFDDFSAIMLRARLV